MFINPYHRGHVYTGTLTMHTNISTHIGFVGEYVYDCHVKIHAGILRFYMGLLMKEEERRGGRGGEEERRRGGEEGRRGGGEEGRRGGGEREKRMRGEGG